MILGRKVVSTETIMIHTIWILDPRFQLIVFKVIYFTCKLDYNLNSSSFLKYLATTLQANISFFYHPLTWNHWELKLFFSRALQLQTTARRLDINQRNRHNSSCLNNLSDWQCGKPVYLSIYLMMRHSNCRPPDYHLTACLHSSNTSFES